MKVTVTLEFDSALEAANALDRMNASTVTPNIAHEDRPDVGAPTAGPAADAAIRAVNTAMGIVPPAPPAVDPAAAFAGAVPPSLPAATQAPTPPAAAVPPAPPAATPPSAAGVPTAAPAQVERDKNGMPWDARIHASTKTQNADGTWRLKRNVDEGLRATVEAELKGLPAPTPAAAAAPVAAPATPVPPAPPAPAATPAAPAGPRDFPTYITQVGAVFTTNPLKANSASTAAAAAVGLQNIGQLAGRPDLIEQFDAVFQAELVK